MSLLLKLFLRKMGGLRKRDRKPLKMNVVSYRNMPVNYDLAGPKETVFPVSSLKGFSDDASYRSDDLKKLNTDALQISLEMFLMLVFLFIDSFLKCLLNFNCIPDTE